MPDMNIELLRTLNDAAKANEAITLTPKQSKEWSELCTAGLGADVWSWRVQDRDWKNNDEPLRIATRKGEEALRSAGFGR